MSSFRKRNVQKPIPGTRTSPQTGQVITSSGNPSLDLILGGGLPIGSICLIEEDHYRTYSNVMAKYFLAESIISMQTFFLGSLDDDPAELLKKLPKPMNPEEVEKDMAAEAENGETPKNGLRIAWRYNDLPIVNSDPIQSTADFGHHFNLLEQMDPVLVDFTFKILWHDTQNNFTKPQQRLLDDEAEAQQAVLALQEEYKDFEHEKNLDAANSNAAVNIDIEMNVEATTTTKNAIDVESMDMEDAKSADTVQKSSSNTSSSSGSVTQQKSKVFENEKYAGCLGQLYSLLLDPKFSTASPGEKRLCRICITSLGSSRWYDEQFPEDLLKFLTVLRAAVRNAVTVCFITMPMHLVAERDPTLVPKIRNLVDFSIGLESFVGSERETNPAFKEYHGLLHLHKIAAINTLSAYMPETTDLAFKLRRKKFVIEKLHLPPELQENNNDAAAAGDAENVRPTLSCASANISSNPKASLDF